MFSIYPSEHVSDFAEQIRRLEVSGQLDQQTAEATLNAPLRSRRDRFAALYYLLHRANRELRHHDYKALTQAYDKTFGKSAYYDTFRAIATAGDRSNSNMLARAIILADKACQRLDDRPGVLHLYATLVADLAELRNDASKDMLDLALSRVRTAIGRLAEPNPHFLATEARLCYANGDSTGALSAISDAIRLQDAAGPDALRRLSTYEAIRTKVTLGIERKGLENLVQQVRGELIEERGRSLQVLSLLAALIALLGLGTTRAPVDSEALLSFTAAFSSMIILVFSTLLLLLRITQLRLFVLSLLLAGFLGVLGWAFS